MKNSTLPVGVPDVAETVAVSVTVCPWYGVLGVTATVVVDAVVPLCAAAWRTKPNARRDAEANLKVDDIELVGYGNDSRPVFNGLQYAMHLWQPAM
jgi:hypothetical protein